MNPSRPCLITAPLGTSWRKRKHPAGQPPLHELHGIVHRTWRCSECDACWIWPACADRPGWPEWPGVNAGALTVHAGRWDHHEHGQGRRSVAGDMPNDLEMSLGRVRRRHGKRPPRCGRHRERGRGTSPRGRCRADPGAVVLNPAGVIHVLRRRAHTFEPHLTRAADERCLIGADVHSRLGALPLRRCDHVRECLGAQIRPGCRYCSGLGKALRFRVHNGAAR